MAEYIEREAALNVCEMHYQHCLMMHDFCGDTTADNIKTDIGTLPAADVAEVRHGYWYEHYGFTICSRCQAMFDTDLTMLQVPSTWEMPNYCPNCGAYMRGGMNE